MRQFYMLNYNVKRINVMPVRSMGGEKLESSRKHYDNWNGFFAYAIYLFASDVSSGDLSIGGKRVRV